MSDLPPEFPPLKLGAFELRLTARALEDLGCPRTFSRTDLDGVEESSPHGWIMRLFRSKYRDSATGTDNPIHGVGRPDIYPCHGPMGGRAVTWFDEEEAICWLLGFTPEHDFTLFEGRAASGELLPDAHDYEVLIVERGALDFDRLTVVPVKEMLKRATGVPGVSLRHTIADLLEIEIIATEVSVDEKVLREFFLSVRMPPASTYRPPGWPHRDIPRRLMELATGYSRERLCLSDPTEVVDVTGSRIIDWQHELAVKTGPLVYPAGELDRILDDDGQPIDHDKLLDQGTRK